MHHTKAKADIGLVKVIADLTAKRYVPCIPLSEHQAYDLVAVSEKGNVSKLQVKYARLKKNGTAELRFRRNWSDSKGTHTRAYSTNEFDYYAIYCPDKDRVLYVSNKKNCPKALRFDKPSSNQARKIKWAENYLLIK